MKPWLSNLGIYAPQQLAPLFDPKGQFELSSSLVVELIESFFWQSVHFIFAPRTVLRQLWICATLQLSVSGILYFRSTFLRIYGKLFRNSFRGKLESLLKELRRAPTYSSWLASAERYDRLVGCDKWRLEANSPFYDAEAVVKRTAELEAFLLRVSGNTTTTSSNSLSSTSSHNSSPPTSSPNTSDSSISSLSNNTISNNENNNDDNDDDENRPSGRRRSRSGADIEDPIAAELFALMFQLRGGLGRTDYGLLHQGLYTRARLGTKLAIERYLSAICSSLRRLANMPAAPPDAYGHHSAHGGLGHGGWGKRGELPPDSIPLEVKLSFFNEMRHAYGRTALMLSGGGMLALYHVGVIKALFLAGLLPRVICGASGGAIVASTFATKTNDELVNLGYFDGYVDSLHFYKVNNRLDGVYLCTDTLREAIQANVGDWTFQEAFDRTGRILNVIVATANSLEQPILLNYLTAPHVLIWSAALASSCSPGFFEAVPLMVREPDGAVVAQSKGSGVAPQLYEDGSMDSSLPMAQLSELFNVNHFIVSQSNPHAGLLSSLSPAVSPALMHPFVGLAASAVTFLKVQMRAWLNNLVTLVTDAGSIPRSTLTRGPLQVLLQEYEGRPDIDVTLFPWKGQISQFSAFTSALDNPTPDEYRVIISASERNTWGQLPQVRAHIAVEVCLEQCVQHLRKALIARDQEGSSSSENITLMLNNSQSSDGSSSPNSNSFDYSPNLKSSKKKISKGMSRVPSFFTSKSQENLLATVAKSDANLRSSRKEHQQMKNQSSVTNLFPRATSDPSSNNSSNVQDNNNNMPPTEGHDYIMPLNDIPGTSDSLGEGNDGSGGDSLKCAAPLFSGHAIVDSPFKGWSWYANGPNGNPNPPPGSN